MSGHPTPPLVEMAPDLPLDTTIEVRDGCVCLHLQRAARAAARRFDEAFRPVGITNGQFSLLVAINRPYAPTVGELAEVLAMDRTTVTAALKPLRRAGWVVDVADAHDARVRRVRLTEGGLDVIRLALPIWRATHAEIERDLPALDLGDLRTDLRAMSGSAR